jgi:hypothetical protein
MARLARALFAIPLAEVRIERRGFTVTDGGLRARFESIGETFVAGYHAALEDPRPGPLGRRLDAIERERRGFAFEGASMGLALVDSLARWRRPAWRAFLEGPGAPHAYMVHVGAGWTLARLGAAARRIVPLMDPLLRWLAFDGFGFHEGFFHGSRRGPGAGAPASLGGYERRAFDQGLGRSLWFLHGADPGRISRAVVAVAPGRRADLWSGVGLACAYAGGADRAGLDALREAAAEHAAWMAQGAAFAAKARLRAGNPAEHTEVACRRLCGLEAAAAAAVTDQALAEGGDPADYEGWRRRVRDRLAGITTSLREAACPVA